MPIRVAHDSGFVPKYRYIYIRYFQPFVPLFGNLVNVELLQQSYVEQFK